MRTRSRYHFAENIAESVANWIDADAGTEKDGGHGGVALGARVAGAEQEASDDAEEECDDDCEEGNH